MTYNPNIAPFLTLRDSVNPARPTLTTAKKKTLTNLEIDANFTALADAIQNVNGDVVIPNVPQVVAGIPKGLSNGALDWVTATPGTDYVAPGTTTQFTTTQVPSKYVTNPFSGNSPYEWDTAYSQVLELTFSNGNITSFTFVGAQQGAFYFLKLTQDSVGGRTAAWSSSFKWPEATAPVLSTGANATDLLTFYFDGFNMLCTGISLGVA